MSVRLESWIKTSVRVDVGLGLFRRRRFDGGLRRDEVYLGPIVRIHIFAEASDWPRRWPHFAIRAIPSMASF